MENLHKVHWIHSVALMENTTTRTPLIFKRCRESSLSVFWAENFDQGTVFPWKRKPLVCHSGTHNKIDIRRVAIEKGNV